MPSAEIKVNQRYCNLLSETFEKYKDIIVISKRYNSDDEEVNTKKRETFNTSCDFIQAQNKDKRKF